MHQHAQASNGGRPNDKEKRKFAYYYEDAAGDPNDACTCDPGQPNCKGLYTGDKCKIICVDSNNTAVYVNTTQELCIKPIWATCR